MKIKLQYLFIVLTIFVSLHHAVAQGTQFTYQGQLNDDANPANGAYDLKFTLFDALLAGNQVGSSVTNSTVDISNGLFTVALDFGANFPGANRWLEIGVRTNGGTAFATLAPRQPLTPTPYAITAGTAAATATPVGMVLIPAGSFTMGNSINDDDITDASPVSVYVSAFYMDANLVNWSQWLSVYYWATDHGYGFNNTGAGKAVNHPVDTLDWYDTVKWCNARSQQAGKTPVYYTDAGLTRIYTNGEPATLYPNWAVSGYRLATEAEWEKAARGGLSGQRFPWGNVITENLANYHGDTSNSYDLGPNGYNSIGTVDGLLYTSPVGSFAANGYGLYDMAGDVFEWCWDWYATPYAGGSDPHGPAGPLTYRVLRGGDWFNNAGSSRCAHRFASGDPRNPPGDFGFRCVKGL
jgi:formylglycine-generating enzyme required for sulfatase activity